jgi:hypothetical protein
MFPLPAFTAPPAWTIALFVAIVLAVAAWFVVAIAKTSERPARAAIVASVAFAAWLAITAGISASGLLEIESFPPLVMIFFFACLALALGFAFSPIGRRVALLPAAALVGVHTFRLPLEIVLERWADAGTIPVQMSFHGDNIDIVTGALAIVCAAILAWRRMRWLELAFHAIGLATLIRVMQIAATSAPGPLRTYDGIVLQLPFHVPYVWIVSICVAGALAAHVIGVRACLARGPGRAPARLDHAR